MRRLLFSVVFVFALIGCAAKHQVNNLAGSNNVRLDAKKGVFITVPSDGAYGTKQYSGSGQTVAQTIASAFSKHASRVHIADRGLSNEEAIDAARKLGAGYVLAPVITHWEHRATEWSGRPSVMAVRITILDAATGEQVSSTIIEGRSRIVSWTTTSPESLLRRPIEKYVDGLY